MFGRVAKLEKACSQNPDAPLFARLADLYLHRGMVHRALALCEEGCERFPDYIAGYMILSKCYEAQEKFEEARIAMDRALRLDPENPGGFVHLSRIYQDLGIPTLALKSLQQAASLDPFNEDLSEQLEDLASEVEAETLTDADHVEAAEEPPKTEDAVPATVDPELIAATAETEQATVEKQIEVAEESLTTATVEEPEWSGLPAEAMVVVEAESYETLPSAAGTVDEGQTEQSPDEPFDQVQRLPEWQEQGQSEPTDSNAAEDILVAEIGDSLDESEPAEDIEGLPPNLFAEEAEAGQAVSDDSLIAEIGGTSAEPASGDSGLDLFIEEGDPEEPISALDTQGDLADLGVAIFGSPAVEEAEGEIPEENTEFPELIPTTSEPPIEGDIPELISFDEEQAVEAPATDAGSVDLITPSEDLEEETDSAGIDSVDLIAFNEELEQEPTPAATQPVDLIAFEDEQAEESPTADTTVADPFDQEQAGETDRVDLIAFDEELEQESIPTESKAVEMVAFDEPQTEGTESADAVDLIAFDEPQTEAPIAVAADIPEPMPLAEEPAAPPPLLEEDPIDGPEQLAPEHGRQNKLAISGLGPQNDAELINLFQEIETQQTQPVDLSPSNLALEDKDELIATETLAEIYSNQGLTQRAIETYKQILEQQPDNETIRHKLTYLEQHLEK